MPPENGKFSCLETVHGKRRRCLNLARLFSYTVSNEKGLNMLKMISRVMFACVVGLFLATGAQAAKVKGMAITPEIEEAANKINAYFNSFQTMKGEFVQTSPQGRASRGVMHLSKPGKLRFEYEAPNPLLIASDGKWLTIKNKQKEKGDQVPLSSTPLRLIVSPKLNLLQEAAVVGFEQDGGFTTMALADKKGSLAGQIVLVFDDGRNELQQWIIIDGKGRRTTVELGNLEKDVKINPKLFQVTIKRNN
jgi:outer membrane lipoprotein-sorting protein